MDNAPSPAPSEQTPPSAAPEAEVLKPRVDDTPTTSPATPASAADSAKKRHRTYRPSHKATFIALGVILAILAINAVVVGLILKSKADQNDLASKGKVSISSEVLSKIGVNTSTIGSSGVELVIDPDAHFNGKVVVAGDVDITGQFNLNNKLNSSEAGIAKLSAGDTSLEQLNVNGKSTLSDLVLRNGLAVTGPTQLQGAVTISQLLTVNSNLTVLGNLAVGGVLSTATFSANSLTSTSTLTIGGHIITVGQAPNVGAGGGALGSAGTVSISGSDAAGRIAINTGVGATPGTLVHVAFKTQYSSAPRVVITAVNVPSSVTCGFYLANLTVAGFSVVVSCSLPPGGYAINYIVVQ